MPQDTIWYNTKGSFFIQDSNSNLHASDIADLIESSAFDPNDTYAYNPKNSITGDSVIRMLTIEQAKNKKITFEKEKSEYDNLASILQFIIFLAAIAMGIYAHKRLKKYRENPFDEDERDWVEIGSSAKNNYGRSYGNKIIYHKPIPKPLKEYLTYNGRDLKFDKVQVIAVLKKRFDYFNALSMTEQKRFLARHKKFMRSKIFKIHTYNGFKEMPILISATAIQLSFGLEEFMLPYYKYIHIFPQEFLGLHPTMRFLEGNVSGNSINISWKHYLEGYEKKADGQNLGLHEMAHAYYCQFNIYNININSFKNNYNEFKKKAIIVSVLEQNAVDKIYSDNAFRNIDEFWAESVEIFFERSNVLKEKHPLLYETIYTLLNQDLTIPK